MKCRRYDPRVSCCVARKSHAVGHSEGQTVYVHDTKYSSCDEISLLYHVAPPAMAGEAALMQQNFQGQHLRILNIFYKTAQAVYMFPLPAVSNGCLGPLEVWSLHFNWPLQRDSGLAE